MQVHQFSSNFFQRIVRNSIPIVKNYIDDMILVSASNQQKTLCDKMTLEPIINSVSDVNGEETFKDNEVKTVTTVSSPGDYQIVQEKKKYTEEEYQEFFNNMLYFSDIKTPADEMPTELVFESLLKKFSENCSVSAPFDINDIPIIHYEFPTNLLPPLTRQQLIVEPRLSITEYVTKQIKGNNNL
jgi:hypothetical protein